MRILTVVVLLFITMGCQSTSLSGLIIKEPKPILEIKQIIEKNKITNKITTNSHIGDLYIVGTCDSMNGNKFAVFSIENGLTLRWSLVYKPKFSPKKHISNLVGELDSIDDLGIWERGSNIGMGINNGASIFSKKEFKNILNDLRINIIKINRRQQIKIAEYTAKDLKINELFDGCNTISNKKDEKRLIEINIEKEKTRKHVENSSKILKRKPMYKGNNINSFLQIENDILNHGEVKFKNKFVWAQGSYYRVTKVNEINLDKTKAYLIVLEFNDYRYGVTNKLPILIASKKKAIIGQTWDQISRTPIVFKGVVSGEKLRKKGFLTFYKQQYMSFVAF